MSPRGRILLVDDDHEIVEFLATLLSLEGFEPKVVSRGSELFHRLDREPADLILMDVAMPDVDGIELCRRVKQDPRTRNVPVFIVSARPGAEIVDRARGAGADELIRKPFENQALVDLLRRRLEGAAGAAP
jgi:DNA-binding response OmpR family regulator